jgi:hypothetical protein
MHLATQDAHLLNLYNFTHVINNFFFVIYESDQDWVSAEYPTFPMRNIFGN